MIRRWIALVACALVAVGAEAAGARQSAPGATAAAAAPQQGTVPAVVQNPAVEGYSYKSEGRRDPFVSLVNRSSDPHSKERKRPDGVAGLSFSEIALRGIAQGKAGNVAIVQAPDNKTYLVHVGDQLFDGVVKAITADTLIGLVEVNDPLSLAKQREVRKTLRAVEEVK